MTFDTDNSSPAHWDVVTKAKFLQERYVTGKHHNNGRGPNAHRLRTIQAY